MNQQRKAVILLSGGLDSATVMAIAKAEGYELYALTFQYGQRHAIEIEAARRIAAALGAKKHLILDLDLRIIGGIGPYRTSGRSQKRLSRRWRGNGHSRHLRPSQKYHFSFLRPGLG